MGGAYKALIRASLCNIFPERIGRIYIVQGFCRCKQRGYFRGGITCDATADGCNQECEFGVLFGKGDKPIHRCTHILHSFHRWNGITPPLQAFALSHDCSEPPNSKRRRSTIVHTPHIAAKDKHLIGLQHRDVLRRNARRGISIGFIRLVWRWLSYTEKG